MTSPSYYSDRKFCPCCEDYVPYLMSVGASYCIECGEKVRLFSKDDWETFNEQLAKSRKGGRPKKRRSTGTGSKTGPKTGTDDKRSSA